MKSSTYGSDRGRPKTVPRPNQLSIWSGQTLHGTPARIPLHRVRPHITRLSRLSISFGPASNPHFSGSPYTYSTRTPSARGTRLFFQLRRSTAPQRPSSRSAPRPFPRSTSGSQVYHHPFRYTSPTRSGGAQPRNHRSETVESTETRPRR
jgi:hypothetical protein